MNYLSRLEKLASLINELGGKVISRKKLQKLVFLMQKNGEDFGQDYRYHHFGPFSDSLATDIEIATSIGALRESRENASFVIELVSESTELGVISKFADPQRKLLKELSKLSPRELEVLSTAVYLLGTGLNKKPLVAKLKELKGDIMRSADLPRIKAIAKSEFGVILD